MEKKIGIYLIIIGTILAAALRFIDMYYEIFYSLYTLEGILFISGLIVGFLNVRVKDINSLLMVLFMLLLIGLVAGEQGYNSLAASAIFISGVGLIIAIKQILVLGKSDL